MIGPLGSGADAATVRGELEAARAARPLTLTEIRAGLRDIFLGHATPARLAALAQAAGLPGCAGRRAAGRRCSRRVDRRGAGGPAGGRAARPAAAARRGDRRRRRQRAAAASVRAALGALDRARHPGRGRPAERRPRPRPRRWTGRGRWPGWPAPRGWRRGPADGAASRRTTCSTWPARGSARRRTRSGSAPGSTSSPAGWTSPRSSAADLLAPAGPRRATGAATGCGCSRSPPRVRAGRCQACHGQGATRHWPDPDQARWSTVTST